jgi:Na+/glutamate symporter
MNDMLMNLTLAAVCALFGYWIAGWLGYWIAFTFFVVCFYEGDNVRATARRNEDDALRSRGMVPPKD